MASGPSNRPKKMAFLVTISPGDTPRLETMLGYARVGVAMGYEMMIFLALDSALVAKRQIFDKLDQKLRERITESINENVRVTVCSASAQTFGIKPEELLTGTEMGGIASFYEYAADAEIVLTWS